MISILLIILKIIGITLLVVIGLILLLLLLVLFVPVRYRFKGSYDEKFLCRGKITWFLHLVSVRIDVEEKIVTSIRILGIPLSVFLKKKDTAKTVEAHQSKGISKETVSVNPEKIEKKTKSAAAVTAKQEESEADIATDKFDYTDVESGTATEQSDYTEGESESTKMQETTTNDKPSLFDKIVAKVEFVKQKIKELIEKIKGTFEKIKNTLINIKEKKEILKRYLAIVRSDTAKAAFSLCKKRIFRVLKHIFPRKMRVDITYGMSDPADTGYILAVYGMMPEFVGKRIILHADFEQPVLKGNFYLKGGIRAWTLLYQLLCVILDKNCQKLYHIVKKEIGNERK